MGYTKSSQLRLVRVLHTIDFSLNIRAAVLKGYLKNVPDDAILNMVVGDDENAPMITFEEKKLK